MKDCFCKKVADFFVNILEVLKSWSKKILK